MFNCQLMLVFKMNFRCGSCFVLLRCPFIQPMKASVICIRVVSAMVSEEENTFGNAVAVSGLYHECLSSMAIHLEPQHACLWYLHTTPSTVVKCDMTFFPLHFCVKQQMGTNCRSELKVWVRNWRKVGPRVPQDWAEESFEPVVVASLIVVFIDSCVGCLVQEACVWRCLCAYAPRQHLVDELADGSRSERQRIRLSWKWK